MNVSLGLAALNSQNRGSRAATTDSPIDRGLGDRMAEHRRAV